MQTSRTWKKPNFWLWSGCEFIARLSLSLVIIVAAATVALGHNPGDTLSGGCGNNKCCKKGSGGGGGGGGGDGGGGGSSSSGLSSVHLAGNAGGGCASCGTPQPSCSSDGRISVGDIPFWYQPARGPRFELQMEYAKILNSPVATQTLGEDWSMSYLSVALERNSYSGEFKFLYGHGLAHRFVAAGGGQWREETSAENSFNRGFPTSGRHFWTSGEAPPARAIFSNEDGIHYAFERTNGVYRLARIGDQFGDWHEFHYASAEATTCDYMVTADNRKFIFEYYSGYSGVPLSAINGKLKRVVGPIRLDGSAIENVTREMSLTYVAPENGIVLLASVTDMAGETYRYEYLKTCLYFHDNNSTYMLSRLMGPDGGTTTIKYETPDNACSGSTYSVTVFYQDGSWDKVLFNWANYLYTANYWNSERGSAAEPLRVAIYNRNHDPDPTLGSIDPLGRRTTSQQFDANGLGGLVGGVFTVNRPYLAYQTYVEEIFDTESDVPLGRTETQFYQDASQLSVAQAELTDPFQKWGIPHKVTEYGADGNVIRIAITTNLVVDETGRILGQHTRVTDGAGRLLSETKDLSGTLDWPTETAAEWPAGFPLDYAVVQTNSGRRLNETEWQETVTEYHPGGAIKLKKERIANTGNASNDFAITKYYVYSDAGDDMDRLAAIWEPARDAIVPTHIEGGTPNYAGLKKTGFSYDAAGRVIVESNTFFETQASAPWQVTTTTYDDLDRAIEARYQDGTFESWSYSCCGIAAHTDRDGNVTLYERDQRRRVEREIKKSARGTTLSDLRYQVDFDGQIVATTDGEGGVRRAEYDRANRHVADIDPLGNRTEYGYDLQNNRYFTKYPNGLVERSFFDDSLNRIHTAAYSNELDAVLSDPNATLQATCPLRADDGHPVVESFAYDDDGKLLRRYGPYKHSVVDYSFNAADPSVEYFYNAAGMVTNTVTDDGVNGFYEATEYNARGLLERRIGPVAVGAAVTSNDIAQTLFYNAAGKLVYTVSAPYIEANNSAVKKRRVVRTEYDYRLGIASSESVGIMDAGTPPTWNVLAGLAYTVVSAQTFDHRGRPLTQFANGLWLTNVFLMQTGMHVVATAFPDGSTNTTFMDGPRIAKTVSRTGAGVEGAYDKAGRVVAVKSSRLASGGMPITQKYTYDAAGHRLSEANHLGEITRFQYDPAGLPVSLTLPDGTVQRKDYDLRGQLAQMTGANAYPVSYGYDAEQRLIRLTDGNGSVTQWTYDALGRNIKKIYNGNSAGDPDLTYAYDLRGNLVSRLDKKGVLTRYWYDNLNRLRGRDYPDPSHAASIEAFVDFPSTEGMDIRYTYDSLSRRVKMEDSTGVSSYAYEGVSTRESMESGPSGKIQRTFASGAMDKLFVGDNLASATYLADYDFVGGRLDSISSGDMSFQYAYLPGSDLMSSMEAHQGGATPFATTRSYDDAGRILAVTNSATDVVSSFRYGYDVQGRRIERTDLDGSSIEYGYNERSELIAAKIPAGDYDYEYQYDAIGNRLLERRNGAVIEGRFNSWNQLTNRMFTGSLDYLGNISALSNRTLSSIQINGTNVPASGTNVAVAGAVPARGEATTLTATAADSAGKKSYQQITHANRETSTYDANGNLSTDDRFAYQWDQENQLIDLSPLVTNTESKRLQFSYDGLGRRRTKTAYAWVAGNWSIQSQRTFVYDGWNLISELVAESGQTRTNQYLWGNDLSGTRQGAGGVGGLLFATLNAGTGTNQCIYAFDANGNVTDLMAPNGAVVGQYQYDSFGNVLSKSGLVSSSNPFRFSSKYCDDESGLYYYGYRFYSPSLGRWLNRDPAEEFGGIPLYAITANNSINIVDPYGLNRFDCSTRKYHGEASGFIVLGLGLYYDTVIEECKCCKSNGDQGRYRRKNDTGTVKLAAGAGFTLDVGDLDWTWGGIPFHLDLAFHFAITSIGVNFTFSNEMIDDECNDIESQPVRFCWDPSLDLGIESIGIGNQNLGLFASAYARFQGHYCVLITGSDVSLADLSGEIVGEVSAYYALAGTRHYLLYEPFTYP